VGHLAAVIALTNMPSVFMCAFQPLPGLRNSR
jgi:hypothetical protein